MDVLRKELSEAQDFAKELLAEVRAMQANNDHKLAQVASTSVLTVIKSPYASQ